MTRYRHEDDRNDPGAGLPGNPHRPAIPPAPVRPGDPGEPVFIDEPEEEPWGRDRSGLLLAAVGAMAGVMLVALALGWVLDADMPGELFMEDVDIAAAEEALYPQRGDYSVPADASQRTNLEDALVDARLDLAAVQERLEATHPTATEARAELTAQRDRLTERIATIEESLEAINAGEMQPLATAADEIE